MFDNVIIRFRAFAHCGSGNDPVISCVCVSWATLRCCCWGICRLAFALFDAKKVCGAGGGGGATAARYI